MSKPNNNTKTLFKRLLNGFKNAIQNFCFWRSHKKRLWQLRLARAPKSQIFLEKGSYYMRKGAVYQVGQPIRDYQKGKTRVRYIKNLYFNFGLNRITAIYSPKPIKGLSEKF